MSISIKEIGTSILYLAFFFLYISGCVHSLKKHKDDGDLMRYSPMSVYRGVEWYWHDDFAGVNWEERLKSDAYTLQVIMNSLGESQHIETLNTQIEKFGNKIRTYPDDKYDYLKRAAKLYYSYFTTVREEMSAYLDSIQAGKYKFDSYGWDDKSKIIQDSLILVYGLKEVSEVNKELNKALVKLRENAALGNIDEVNEVRSNMQKNGKIVEDWMTRVYEMLFKESLSLNLNKT